MTIPTSHLVSKVALLLILANSVGVSAQIQPTSPSPVLKIIHFNVGNADATLIVVEDGSGTGKSLLSVLIDGGSRSMAANVVIPGIHDQKIEALDYIIATHNDSNHTAGLNAVLQSIPMTGEGAFYDRDRRWPLTNDEPPLKPGMPINFKKDALKALKDKFEIKCVAVNGDTPDLQWNGQKPALDENAKSLALILGFGKFRYFIGGDLTGGGLSGWTASPDIESRVAKSVGQVNVLRVNHHGSVTSTNSVFLEALNPAVAIISAGSDPRTDSLFHWPSQKVLARLSALTNVRAIYVTGTADTQGLADQDKKKLKDSQGNVTISTTGEGTFQVNGNPYPLPK
jgi:competence protein ComEC